MKTVRENGVFTLILDIAVSEVSGYVLEDCVSVPVRGRYFCSYAQNDDGDHIASYPQVLKSIFILRFVVEMQN